MTRVLFLVALVLPASELFAQPNYYESRARQNAEYRSLSNATRDAFATPGGSTASNGARSSSAGSSSSGSSSGARASASGSSGGITSSGNDGWVNYGGGDRVRRMEEAGRRNEERRLARVAMLQRETARFTALIADRGLAATDEDLLDLVLLGQGAGVDGTAIFLVLGNNLAEYRAKFGVDPKRPYRPRDGRVDLADHALRELQKPEHRANPQWAAASYRQVAGGYPTMENFTRWGDAAYNALMFRDAVEAYTQARKLGEQGIGTAFGLALSKAYTDDHAGALALYETILEPSEGVTLPLSMAWVQLDAGRAPEVVRATARLAYQRDTTDTRALLVLAALTDDARESATLSARAAALEPALTKPSLAAQLYALGRMLQKEGDYPESLLYLDLAVRLDPKSLDYLELRLGTNQKLGRAAQARRDEATMSKM